MNADELRDLLHREPFAPFRIFMTDGNTYDIRHPEMAMPTRSTVHVGIEEEDGRGIADEVVYLSLGHIVRIEHLEDPKKSASQSGNGS